VVDARDRASISRARTRRPPPLASWLVGAAMVAIAALFFFPMVWMVLSSFKSDRAIFESPFALPESIDLANWRRRGRSATSASTRSTARS
jgi:raffinose/stachyose/melibiose transport system permease protein